MPQLINGIMQMPDIKGIILRTFGSGNALWQHHIHFRLAEGNCGCVGYG